MANIILPQVSILNEINDSTNLMVEQNGEINRYPISDLDITEDQVIMDDGRRLSGTNFLSIDKEGSSFAEPNPVNADTLGGKLASEYATNDFVNEKVRKAAPRNLLDNSDFSNPVNQRHSTKYMVSSDYTIDRWNAWHENGKTHVTIENGYLKIWAENTGGGSFSQRFIKGLLSENKNYTFAYKTNEGNIVINNNPVVYGEVYDHVEITLSANETVNTEWAALYEGEYTAETLPEYQPKGYGAELLECQRYLFVSTNPFMFGFITSSGSSAELSVPMPVKMRIVPTVTYNSAYVRSAEGNTKGTDLTVVGFRGICVMVRITLGTSMKASSIANGYMSEKVIFSAEL